ncbi:MAG: S41 family peptidase [Pseudomonadota bacterium]
MTQSLQQATGARLFIFLLILIASACNDSGGSSPTTATVAPPPAPTPGPTPTPAPTPAGPTWIEGVFEPARNFINRCEAVRTGVDIEGNAFPDRPGSTLEEKFWLRSWTNETYLFNTDVVDRDPNSFADRLSYFAVLRTTATTPSGEDVDDFHFSEPTVDFLARRNSAPSATYGARFVAISDAPPRDFRILYTEPNSPASEIVNGEANFKRGARLLEVDGIDLINANSAAELDALNAGLFPQNSGERHTFLVEDVDGDRRAVTLTSVNLAFSAVNRIRVIDTPAGRVGYVLLNTFSPFASEEEIAAAITDLAAQGIDDIVVDLRYNGGGLLATAAQLSYMVAGDAATTGRDFERLRFNAAAGGRNPVTGELDNSVPFYDEGLGFSLARGTPLPALDLPRIFILTTEQTCSASEAVINGLRGVFVDVILIGETTCGKPFGFYPQDNCGETYYTIQFQGVNDLGFGDYTDGFIAENSTAAFGVRAPGCVANDDLSHELGDADEGMLSTALFFRETGACPAISATASSASAVAIQADDPMRLSMPTAGIMETNRDMTMPE